MTFLFDRDVYLILYSFLYSYKFLLCSVSLSLRKLHVSRSLFSSGLSSPGFTHTLPPPYPPDTLGPGTTYYLLGLGNYYSSTVVGRPVPFVKTQPGEVLRVPCV